jgi:hypothetical protein
MSVDEGFKILGPYLWEYEKSEIFNYESIYFFNVNERKKANRSKLSNDQQTQQLGKKETSLPNHGFDNEN